MLIEKIRLEKAIENKEPLSRVEEFYQEYREAYKQLRRPSAKHNRDFENLYIKYDEYRKKNADNQR